MSKKINLFNIKLDNLGKQELLDKLDEGILFTPNVDHFVKLQKDPEFHKIYERANFIVLDSKVVQLALHFLGNPVKEVIPGSDFFPSFYQYHKKNKNIKIFLLGAASGVGEIAMQRINEKVERDIIVGTYSPERGFEDDPKECKKIVEMINSSGATVLAAGLGAPKQEKWIAYHFDSLDNIKIAMGIGATIDFEAGNVKRAPIFFRKLGLEWLYRLLLEPKRLWKRYLYEDMTFFKMVLKEKLNVYKNPFPIQNKSSEVYD